MENTTPNKETLESLSKWSGFVSIMMIISGALMCLGAIGSLGLSLIPGIITIILGVKLRNAKNSIKNYIHGNSGELSSMLDHMASYFKLQGILIIISLVLTIIGIVIGSAVIFSFITESGFQSGFHY